MKKPQPQKQWTVALAAAGTLLASLFVLMSQPVALAQDASQPEQQNDKKSAMMSKCPMMDGLKGIKLVAESPPLLIARAEELKLTEEQKRKLASIAEEAQRNAAAVLTEKQREILGDSAGKSMSMMEIAMMRAEKSRSDSSEGMCPMCQQKMDKMKEKMKKKRNVNSTDTK